MKKIFYIVLFFISAGNCFGQQVTFQKTIGGLNEDQPNFVRQTADGGYIITGITNSFGAGDYDIYLIKTDANGDSLWTKTFGGTDTEWGSSVRQTSDGGYIITGFTKSFGIGTCNLYLIKTDANGNPIWTKTFGENGIDGGNSVQQTTDGGYIIAGYSASSTSNGYDVYLIKTDANGDSLWTKYFGGTAHDFGNSIQQTSDGGYIMVGYTYSFGAGNEDVYLIKVDVNGNLLWSKTFGGTNDEEGNEVQQTSDGGYIITGYSGSFGAGGWDVYLIKTDANGDSLWTRTFGGSDFDMGWAVQQSADSGYIIAGSTGGFASINSNAYLIKTDANGDSLWTKVFGVNNSEYSRSVQPTADGGYIIVGGTTSFGAEDPEVYLIKTDSLGNSNCNEGGIVTIITTPATQVTSPSTIVTSTPTIVTIPATIVGSGGTVTTLCTTVGIHSAIQNPPSTITISPNPTTNNFTITFPSPINKGVIEIYNVLGEKIFTENIFNVSQKEIRLNNINAGIYFVKVRGGEKEYLEKVVIDK